MDHQADPVKQPDPDIWPPAPSTAPIEPSRKPGFWASLFSRPPQIRHNLGFCMAVFGLAFYHFWGPDFSGLGDLVCKENLPQWREFIFAMALMEFGVYTSLVEIVAGAINRRGWSVVFGLVVVGLMIFVEPSMNIHSPGAPPIWAMPGWIMAMIRGDVIPVINS